MNRPIYPSWLRIIALVVVSAFLLQEAAVAAPEIKPFEWHFSNKPDIRFELPYSVAFVEDAWAPGTRHQAPGIVIPAEAGIKPDPRLRGDDKLVILIQDAHTNESGQINVAKALDIILEEENIRYVFLEAGSGDASLSFLRDRAPL